MKKASSVFLSVIIILSVFSFSAFSLTDGNYTYILENGKAVITGYSGNASTLTIPSTLGGYEVYAIGEGAFQNNTALTEVTVSSGICEVRANAFKNCTALSTISLPDTLIRFGEEAIYNTAYYNDTNNWTIRPENLNSSSGNIIIGNGQDSIPIEFIRASVLEYIYLGKVLVKCVIVGSYSIKVNTTVVADGAFSGQSGLTSININKTLVTIGARAFKDCTSLKKISLRDDVTVYDDAFLNTEIYNDSSNWKGDVLSIDGRAIAVKQGVTEINIGNGITYIPYGIIGTKNVYIPESVTKIDLDAFTGKSSVIFGYSGTYAEEFALENGFMFVDMDNIFSGDLDYDGKLNSNDYAMLSATVLCQHTATKYEKIAGDLNMDGAVDMFDVILLQILINDQTATVRGDINGDGQINKNDYIFLTNIVQCNCKGVGENFLSRSDLNGDGVVDTFDVIHLDLYLNGRVSL